ALPDQPLHGLGARVPQADLRRLPPLRAGLGIRMDDRAPDLGLGGRLGRGVSPEDGPPPPHGAPRPIRERRSPCAWPAPPPALSPAPADPRRAGSRGSGRPPPALCSPRGRE